MYFLYEVKVTFNIANHNDSAFDLLGGNIIKTNKDLGKDGTYVPLKHSSDIHVVVTGDFVVDWNLMGNSKIQSGSNLPYPKMCWQRGGCALLADFIDVILKNLPKNDKFRYFLHQPNTPRIPVPPDSKDFIHNFNLWEPVKERDTFVWRMKEGLGNSYDSQKHVPNQIWQNIKEDPEDAELVIIDDANLGFRTIDFSSENWPRSLKNPKHRPWVLIKCSNHVINSSNTIKTSLEIWERLLKDYADRIILVISADDLRKSDMQISQELSWERMAQDLLWELVYNLRHNNLSSCAHVIISFGAAGAFLLSNYSKKSIPNDNSNIENESTGPICHLFFDPNVIENTWEQEHPGRVTGTKTTLTASLAHQILINPENPDIHKGIGNGLNAIRRLILDGYGTPGQIGTDTILKFPFDSIANELNKESSIFSEVVVRDPTHNSAQEIPNSASPSRGIKSSWTILEQKYFKDLPKVAENIVVKGPERALEGIPIARFGKLMTVDRTEIEGFRGVRALINEYCKQPSQKRPLNIAVFGTPGSGKSFGITEISKSLFPELIEVLEFNLSQYEKVEEMYSALHQVRDSCLHGKIPIVFWDEFDTSKGGYEFGWLRYFLMPMQDGKFQVGEISHPIGKAIFVFAGGTSINSKEFEDKKVKYPMAKIPDFISRLKGTLNILGPNRVTSLDSNVKDLDPYYIIRRAFVLRSILEREKSTELLFTVTKEKIKRLNIDLGVLRALLLIREYKHGSRSIESLLMMSSLSGKTSFERSYLPNESQLEIHVDSREFLALVQQLELDGDLLELFAKVNHVLYCEEEMKKIKRERKESQVEAQQPPLTWQKKYDELSDDEKEQNRDTVRDIPRKLATLGYVMIPSRGNERSISFSSEEVERLAKLEHYRWVKMKIASGWKYASITDKNNKTHKDLVPWTLSKEEIKGDFADNEIEALGKAELLENEKKKNRDIISHIPQLLSAAGYVIIKPRI